MSDRHLFGSSIPCEVEVEVLNLVVAPPAVNWGAETSVLGLLQSGEAVFEETLKARLSGFQQGHVLKSTVNHRDACKGSNSSALLWDSQAWIPVTQVNPHTIYRLTKCRKTNMWLQLLRILVTDSGHVILVNTTVQSSIATASIFNRIFFFLP